NPLHTIILLFLNELIFMKKSKEQIWNELKIYFTSKPLFSLKSKTTIYRLDWKSEVYNKTGHWYSFCRNEAMKYKNFGAANRLDKDLMPYLIEGEVQIDLSLREVRENHLAVFDKIYDSTFNHSEIAEDLSQISKTFISGFDGFIRIKEDPLENEVFIIHPLQHFTQKFITPLPLP
ncbi:hypothetical protein, partial [Erwinia amylovora]|uniref:hypothetical protein n=1 Tax=Erwinia amylovora TaxID=552 RepID=UPI0019623C0E